MPTSNPTTLLSLPIEIRLQIYDYVLSASNIHSFRPHRKIGWNRPHADLSNPALLFESDAPLALKQLFHSKLTKSDHALILGTVLRRAKILIVDHADFSALLKIAALPRASTATVSGQPKSSLAAVVKENLRTVDFSDRMDEIVCQPNDIVKLVRGLPGLRAVHLTSKHVQRYSGTIDEHVDFARERANREIAKMRAAKVVATAKGEPATSKTHSRGSHGKDEADVENTAAELRRLTLRSPMTDGTRMVISPAIFSRSLPHSTQHNTRHGTQSDTTWVVVDLSMIVWQHFLYTGAPYRDHWRTIRMSTLLEIAQKRNVHVVMNFRNVEFDPLRVDSSVISGSGYHPGGTTLSHQRQGGLYQLWTQRQRSHWERGLFKGEMSTSDWVLRLRQVTRSGGVEYGVRQRRAFDEMIGQEGCGLTRCRHSRGRRGSVCDDCSVS